MIDDSNLIVKKNNFLEASYNMSTLELKIIIVALSKIKKDDKKFSKIIINVKEFNDLIGTNGTTIYNNIKKACCSLISRTLKIYTDDNFEMYTWMKYIKYNNKSGTMELKFNEDIIPFLLFIKDNFTSYMLKDIIHLKSKYAIRIYELLKQYETIGNRTLELENLKELLCLDKEYKLYGHFKSRVLESARKELENHSDIRFTYQEIKTGRKIVAIKFYIIKNENDESYNNYDKFKLTGMIQNEFYNRFNINLHHIDFLSKHRIILLDILRTLKSVNPSKIKYPERWFNNVIIESTNKYDLSKIQKLRDF